MVQMELRHTATEDLAGRRFGLLEVVGFAGYWVNNRGTRFAQWNCKCDCGGVRIARADRLKLGGVRSCGCLSRGTSDRMHARTQDLTGVVFSRLTVVSFAGYSDSGSRTALWLCRCECGAELVVRSCNLKSGGTQSCGCLLKDYMSGESGFNGRTVDIAGMRSGRLVVRSFAGFVDAKNSRVATWVCDCDCGSEVVARATDIKQKAVRSCGCLAKENCAKVGRSGRLPNSQSAKNALYAGYVRNAKIRGYEFALTHDQFDSMIASECHYCKSPPSTKRIASQWSGVIVYNGIDRKNNSSGYTLENCVPCCKQCNFAKHNMSYDEFIAWRNGLVARMAPKLN